MAYNSWISLSDNVGIVTHCSWSKVQCTDTITDNWLRLGFTINTCDSVYPPPHLRLLLLLSGDVELNPGPITGKHTLNTTLINWYTTVGNPKDILRTHSYRLTDAISTNLYRVTDALYAKGLISQGTKAEIHTTKGIIPDYQKSCQLLSALQTQLEASLTPDKYLIDICHVLINQQHKTLKDIATNMLQKLGEWACVQLHVYGGVYIL